MTTTLNTSISRARTLATESLEPFPTLSYPIFLPSLFAILGMMINHIIAVWNTAARLHLEVQNPTWLQDLACDILEANWHLNNIASHPICNARHAETALGLKKFEKLHSDKMQTTRRSHRTALGEVAPLSHQSEPGLTLTISDWKSWTYLDGSCHIQEGKTVIGAGVYHPSSGSSNSVEPNGAGITSTIGRAELAAIASAITHTHIHFATDSLTSILQIGNNCCSQRSTVTMSKGPPRNSF